MANRHLARSIILQTAFEWDFRGLSREEALLSLKRNNTEFGEPDAELSFMEVVLKGVIDKKEDLDNIIIKAAPDWPIEKISNVDRNILRIGLFELLFADRKEVPAKVAINEAIELAKEYGGEKSGGFVNGVLGTVYKQIGEPGKEEKSRKDRPTAGTPKEELPIRNLVGAVVYSRKDSDIYMAFVHDVFGRWTLSKGKLTEGENDHVGLKREVKEEMGIEVEPEELLEENEYIANHPREGRLRKKVKYYLSRAEMQELVLGKSGGLDDAKWFKIQDIEDLNFYDDILPILTKAITIISQKEK